MPKKGAKGGETSSREPLKTRKFAADEAKKAGVAAVDEHPKAGVKRGNSRLLEVPFNAEQKALCIARIALKKKAEDIALLHLGALSSVSDYYVICTAHSGPQIQAIVEAVEDALVKKGCRPLGIEGIHAALWVLMDYNDVLFHIFTEETRTFYNLDRIWNDVPRIDFSEETQALEPKQKITRRKIR